ncbi:MAG: hypothetical protein AB7O37_10250 [Vicinamibacteria bacterium]
MLRPALFAAVLAAAPGAAQQPAAPPPEPEPQYFEKPADEWRFGLGTDTGFTASNLEDGSTNETNDGSSNLDAIWMRLYAKLSYGEKAELVVDLYSADARAPSIFGLYGRVEPKRWLGVRVGMIPLVVGAWQERAYPHLQPLINQPLSAQYLTPVRTDGVPTSADELLSQRGLGGRTSYPAGSPGAGIALALMYEHCWDSGIEAFGTLGGLRYRVALMEGSPGAGAAKYRDLKEGYSGEGRLTYQIGDSLRLGASFSQGPYLLEVTAPFLPAGSRPRDYDQRLYGGDLRFEKGPLEARAEWTRSELDSPWIAETLGVDGYWAELSVRLAPAVRLAARYSGLAFDEITAGDGRRLGWDADARRIETGVAWRFLEDRLALKGVYQNTRVELAPVRNEDIYALQLSFSF